MRISDWSSDVCSSDLIGHWRGQRLLMCAGRATQEQCGGKGGQGNGAEGIMHVGSFWAVRHPASPNPRERQLKRESGRSADRKSVVKGKRVSVSVDRGGRRILKKTKHSHKTQKN